MDTAEVILVLLMLQIDVRLIFIITDGQIHLVFVSFRLQYHCCRLDELLYYETGFVFLLFDMIHQEVLISLSFLSPFSLKELGLKVLLFWSPL